MRLHDLPVELIGPDSLELEHIGKIGHVQLQRRDGNVAVASSRLMHPCAAAIETANWRTSTGIIVICREKRTMCVNFNNPVTATF